MPLQSRVSGRPALASGLHFLLQLTAQKAKVLRFQNETSWRGGRLYETMLTFTPIKISGRWQDGFALDLQTLNSVYRR
jgi:hypothetical protein